MMANALKTGYSLAQALDVVANKASPPINQEFDRVVKEVNLGAGIEESLGRMVRRTESSDLDMVATAIAINRKIGGNLSEILETISETIRERVRIKGEMSSMTAQARGSGYMITALPLVLAVFMYFVTPAYFAPMLGSPIGIGMLIGAGIGMVLGLLIGLLVGHGFIGPVAGIAVGALIGFYAPLYWVNSLTGSRRIEIQRALPDAMDLLTIASEAGQSFDAAISNVVDKYHNALADEFAAVIRETQLGRPRLEALEEMGKRCGVEDLNNFIQSVIQSEQMGVGIAKILRIQSQELRRKRRQPAQETAAQATLTMMLPMVGCSFPTLWIILLGPAVLVIIKARAGG